MSVQIAIRLPDDLVDFVDDLVRSGAFPSRAAAVKRALERERRRRVAERDAAILASFAGDPYPDLEGLTEVARRVEMSDLD